MLGILGENHRSLSIECNTEDAHKCTLKVYPRVVHYIKARGIGIDLPSTNRGIKTRLGNWLLVTICNAVSYWPRTFLQPGCFCLA